MKEVKEKLNDYFARIDGYSLTDEQLKAIKEAGVKDVTLAIMDSKRIINGGVAVRSMIDHLTRRFGGKQAKRSASFAKEVLTSSEANFPSELVDIAKTLPDWFVKLWPETEFYKTSRETEAAPSIISVVTTFFKKLGIK